MICRFWSHFIRGLLSQHVPLWASLEEGVIPSSQLEKESRGGSQQALWPITYLPLSLFVVLAKMGQTRKSWVLTSSPGLVFLTRVCPVWISVSCLRQELIENSLWTLDPFVESSYKIVSLAGRRWTHRERGTRHQTLKVVPTKAKGWLAKGLQSF